MLGKEFIRTSAIAPIMHIFVVVFNAHAVNISHSPRWRQIASDDFLQNLSWVDIGLVVQLVFQQRIIMIDVERDIQFTKPCPKLLCQFVSLRWCLPRHHLACNGHTSTSQISTIKSMKQNVLNFVHQNNAAPRSYALEVQRGLFESPAVLHRHHSWIFVEHRSSFWSHRSANPPN